MSKLAKISLILLSIFLIFCATLICMFFCSFKTDYKNTVEIYSKQNNISSSLVFSIIKAESKFDKNAKSSANALGLMQLKLSTANYMASILGDEQIVQEDLFVPEINIKYGTKYISYLIKKFGNLQTSICAYNAGETIVTSWLKDPQYSDDGVTLKKIPYAETDKYLKKVNFNLSIYQKIIK